MKTTLCSTSAVAVLAIFAAGCGDGGNDAAAVANPSAVATTAAGATTPTGSATTTTTESTGSGSKSAPVSKPTTTGSKSSSSKSPTTTSTADDAASGATTGTTPAAKKHRRSGSTRKPSAATGKSSTPAAAGAPTAKYDPAIDERDARATAEAVFSALAAKDSDAICHRLYTQHRMELMSNKQGDEAVADCENKVKKGIPIKIKEYKATRSVDASNVDVDVVLTYMGYDKPTRLSFVRASSGWQLDRTGPPR